VKSGFFLDVIVWEGSSILQLFSSKDESLLIRWNSFFVLDFGFNIINSVWRFNIQCYGLSSECFDKDLHASSESENQMESRFFLNIVVREGSAIF
jgi:hypothetical protein